MSCHCASPGRLCLFTCSCEGVVYDNIQCSPEGCCSSLLPWVLCSVVLNLLSTRTPQAFPEKFISSLLLVRGKGVILISSLGNKVWSYLCRQSLQRFPRERLLFWTALWKNLIGTQEVWAETLFNWHSENTCLNMDSWWTQFHAMLKWNSLSKCIHILFFKNSVMVHWVQLQGFIESELQLQIRNILSLFLADLACLVKVHQNTLFISFVL